VLELCIRQKRSPLLQQPSKKTLCDALPFLREKMGPVAGKERSSSDTK
jgi:hypothetical protein